MKKNLPQADEQKPEKASLHSPSEAPSSLSTSDLVSIQPEQMEDPLVENAPAVANQIGSEINPLSETKEEEEKPSLGILDEALQKQHEGKAMAQSSREVQKKRIRERKRRRRISSVKSFGTILSIIVCLLAMIYFLPPFHVQSFQVEGAHHISEASLIETAEIKVGDHLLSGWGGGIAQWIGLRNGRAEERIKASSPYVEDVRVAAKFPGVAYIELTERVPISYIDYQGEIVMLDKNGTVLESTRTSPHDVPLIYNVKMDTAVPGEMVSDEVKKSLRPAILVLNALINVDKSANDDFNLLSQVKTISLTEGADTYITLSQAYAAPNTRIKLGNRQTLDEALNWLRYAARTDNLLKLGEGTLDITGTKKYFYPGQGNNTMPETLPTEN